MFGNPQAVPFCFRKNSSAPRGAETGFDCIGANQASGQRGIIKVSEQILIAKSRTLLADKIVTAYFRKCPFSICRRPCGGEDKEGD
jgi:hypothetical protein